MAEHAIPKITRPPHAGFHLGRGLDAVFGRFDRSADCFA
jgi:hypothetical protein